MSNVENRDQGAGLPSANSVTVKPAVARWVASIVNRQKEEIIRSVNEMVFTKQQQFEARIKESHQDLAESVSGAIIDPYNFKKKEMSSSFNSIKTEISFKTASALNTLKRNKLNKPRKNYMVFNLLPDVRNS